MLKKIIFILLGIIGALILGFIAIGFIKPTYNGGVTVTVNAPVSTTFAVFNDTANMRKWMDNFKRIENISGAENEVGSKWKLVYDENGRDLVMTETITAFEQDKLFAFNMEDEYFKMDIEIRFEEKDGKTIITQTDKGEGKNLPARSMVAIMGSLGLMQKQQQGMYNKLKDLVEKTK
ncbi:MAG: hypothetical protein POELPBGB_01954 [Bacteroidia bacterium]|nr:hypothetical protein [Bacteroidia bacterium]